MRYVHSKTYINHVQFIPTTSETYDTCWWFRNPANQLIGIGYPRIIYRVLGTSQVVVWDFWTINSMARNLVVLPPILWNRFTTFWPGPEGPHLWENHILVSWRPAREQQKNKVSSAREAQKRPKKKHARWGKFWSNKHVFLRNKKCKWKVLPCF